LSEEFRLARELQLKGNVESTTTSGSQTPLLTIKPSTGWSALNLRELNQYRGLALVFAIRDIKLRYRQTLLGPIWIVLQPLLGAGVLSFVFGGIAKLKPPNGTPVFLYCFTGQLAWSIFAGTVTKVSGSLTGNAHLVSKVYFPRLLLPISTVFAVLVDFCAAALILPFLLILYQVMPGLPLLLTPVWMLLLAILGMGFGLCAAALMVSYRDVNAVLGVFMGFLPYLSAVGFDVNSIPRAAKPLVVFNPVIGLLEGFRWSVANQPFSGSSHLAYSVIFSIGMFVFGVAAFKRMERKFADVI
jgi:lipopolysaccharide transport system permease protein